MKDELKMVKELERYGFIVIQNTVKSEDSKYFTKALMTETIRALEDAIYEKHGGISQF